MTLSGKVLCLAATVSFLTKLNDPLSSAENQPFHLFTAHKSCAKDLYIKFNLLIFLFH